MKWTQELESVVKTPSFTDCGTSCYFVKLTPETGIKLYATKLERDASYVAQAVAAEQGFGPKVGDCVELSGVTIPYHRSPHWWTHANKNKTPKILYGFLTEVISVGGSTSAERSKLQRMAMNAGLGKMPDIGGPNVGKTKDGVAVIVDFDARMTGLLRDNEYEIVAREYDAGYENWLNRGYRKASRRYAGVPSHELCDYFDRVTRLWERNAPEYEGATATLVLNFKQCKAKLMLENEESRED